MEVRLPFVEPETRVRSDSGEPMTPVPTGVPVGLAPYGPRPYVALVAEHLPQRFADRVVFDDVSFRIGYREVFGFPASDSASKTTHGTRAPLLTVSRKDANVSNQNL
jgi:hypothetical protein